MKKLIFICFIFIIALLSIEGTAAMPGFSIQGGLLYDKPTHKVFEEMDAGIGYMGNIGFDFSERLGLVVGVMHSTHNFTYDIEGNAVRERDAEKNTIQFSMRAVPLKFGKANIVVAAGPAYFDISGPRKIVDLQTGNIYEMEADYSGWGMVADLDLRYFVTEGLALTFYLSANFVRYNKYSINRLDTGLPGGLPRGDSISWGLTIFHRIGTPKF